MSEKGATTLGPNYGAAKITAKRAQLLAELSETLNTLTSIREVLDDIAALTEPVCGEVSQEGSIASSSERNVSQKMDRLVSELLNWEDPTSNEDVN